MRIHDLTAACQRSWHNERHVEGLVDTVLVHRIAVSEDAAGVAKWFETNPEGIEVSSGSKTGKGKMPYHFVIKRDGTIEQALRLNVRGPHAQSWNGRSVAVVLIGDFTKETPPTEQLEALEWLSRYLALALSPELRVYRHDELAGAAGPGHICPGPKLDLSRVKQVMLAQVHNEAMETLLREGLIR